MKSAPEDIVVHTHVTMLPNDEYDQPLKMSARFSYRPIFDPLVLTITFMSTDQESVTWHLSRDLAMHAMTLIGSSVGDGALSILVRDDDRVILTFRDLASGEMCQLRVPKHVLQRLLRHSLKMVSVMKEAKIISAALDHALMDIFINEL